MSFFIGGKHICKTGYNTKEDASKNYALKKDKYIKELLYKYKNVLDNRVYNTLFNYKTPIYKKEN